MIEFTLNERQADFKLIRITHAYFSLSFSGFSALDLCYTEDTKANVTVLDLKDFYEKGQSRRKANSEQRLLNADVHLKATAQKQIQVTYT